MSLKENILRETYDYNGPYILEDFTLTKFVKGFIEDYKYFGENTADVYKALFMLGEDVKLDLLQENIEEVSETVNNLKVPFLFEGFINERAGVSLNKEREGSSAPRSGGTIADLSKALQKEADRKAAGTQTVPEYSGPFSPPGGYDPRDAVPQGVIPKLSSPDLKLPIGGSQSPAELKKTLEAAIAAPSPEAATKILASAQSAGSVATSGASAAAATKGMSAAVKGAGGVAKVAPKGILGWVGQAFGKVKNFFTGGVSSVGSAIKSGNWGALMKIPLVQGALAAGGAVLAFKLLKKIFGKKINSDQEAQLQAALQKGGK